MDAKSDLFVKTLKFMDFWIYNIFNRISTDLICASYKPLLVKVTLPLLATILITLICHVMSHLSRRAFRNRNWINEWWLDYIYLKQRTPICCKW